MSFVDPRSTPFVEPRSRGELPHLYKPGGYYFVTYRLLDAVKPARQVLPPNVPYSELSPAQIADAYDPPITLGSCVLARPDVARICQDALLKGDQERYLLAAWCIMPNHVHGVFAPLGSNERGKILQSWKGGSARLINQLLGRSGPLWERESFDHLVRNVGSLERFIDYTDDNPVRAGLCARREDWPFSGAGIGHRFVLE